MKKSLYVVKAGLFAVTGVNTVTL